MHFSHFPGGQTFFLELAQWRDHNITLANCNQVGNLIRQIGFIHDGIKTLEQLVWIRRLGLLHIKVRIANRYMT